MELLAIVITASLISIAHGRADGVKPGDDRGEVCKKMTPGHGTKDTGNCPYTIELEDDVVEFLPNQTHTGLILSHLI